jgi:hypothetical protein
MFANLLEESYKILYQSEHLKKKEYLIDCKNATAFFIRSLQNVERVTKNSGKKSSFISQEDFLLYESMIQVDKDIQIKGILESTNKVIIFIKFKIPKKNKKKKKYS